MKRYFLATILILLAATSYAFDFGLNLNFAGGQKKCTNLLPVPSFSPTSVAFGNHSTGTTSDSVVTLSNTGTSQLSAASLAVTGTSFTLQSTTCGSNPFDLAAGADCTVTVRFAPLTAAAFTGSLTMSAVNLDNVVASLSGTGVNTDPPTTPVISVTPGNTTNLIALTSGGEGATSYDVKWGLSSGSRGNTISSVSLPYSHTGLTNGTPYYYSLLAVNSNGSAESIEASGTPEVGGYSDSFTGTDDTLLATHDANWMSPGATYLVSRFEIIGNTVTTLTSFLQAGAYYDASISDTSQIVFKALSNTSQTVPKNIAVRMGSSTLGYSANLATLSGGNWTNAQFKKNGSTIGVTCTGLSISAGSDHTVKITAVGTSSVTLTFFVDDIQVCQTTDSSSTIESGHPGFYVAGNGTVGNNAFDDWRDY